MLNVSYQETNWYFCLAGVEPKVVYPDVPPENRNLNLGDPNILKAVISCRKRWLVGGKFFSRGCHDCVCRERVDLEKLS